MLMPDVNILVYAHRRDDLYHRPYSLWLDKVVNGSVPFCLSVLVAVAFVRIVTNRRIYRDPTPLAAALATIEQLADHPRCRLALPGPPSSAGSIRSLPRDCGQRKARGRCAARRAGNRGGVHLGYPRCGFCEGTSRMGCNGSTLILPRSAGAPSHGRKRVVLLDRDGTVVIDRGYLADPAGLEFLPGAAEGLRRLYQGGWRLVIISNQSGVGRGLFTLARLDEMNQRLRQMVREAGADLAGIYCCPHRPEDGCACRKPNVELVRQAAHELQFEPSAAVVIGDRDSDIELGRRLGATSIRLSPQAAASHGARPPGGHRRTSGRLRRRRYAGSRRRHRGAGGSRRYSANTSCNVSSTVDRVFAVIEPSRLTTRILSTALI